MGTNPKQHMKARDYKNIQKEIDVEDLSTMTKKHLKKICNNTLDEVDKISSSEGNSSYRTDSVIESKQKGTVNTDPDIDSTRDKGNRQIDETELDAKYMQYKANFQNNDNEVENDKNNSEEDEVVQSDEEPNKKNSKQNRRENQQSKDNRKERGNGSQPIQNSNVRRDSQRRNKVPPIGEPEMAQGDNREKVKGKKGFTRQSDYDNEEVADGQYPDEYGYDEGYGEEGENEGYRTGSFNAG